MLAPAFKLPQFMKSPRNLQLIYDDVIPNLVYAMKF